MWWAALALTVLGADEAPEPELADAGIVTEIESPERDLGRRYVRWFLAGNEVMAQVASKKLTARLGGPQGWVNLAKKVKGDFGEETRLMHDEAIEHGGLTVYTRLSQYARYARGVELSISWKVSGEITDVTVRTAETEAPTQALDYVHKRQYRLPFEGALHVLWGGRTWELNRHASVSDQRFALDLLVWKGGGTSTGDGRRNEQYHCFGRWVVAPAAGTVVRVTQGVIDNAPGSVNPRELYGNHLVLDHGDGEYSLLAHLMAKSIRVREGDVVKAGHRLARVGNSGTSTEPHLHYQLMDAPEWKEAHGLPAKFWGYSTNAKKTPEGEPRRGQLIGP